jgi:hypothetical protein
MLMLYIYLASLVLGGIFLGASIFAGGDHDAELDADVDVDVDADHDLDIDVDADADADIDAGADVATEGVDFADFWLPFLSVRFWVFFLTFFGLTGTLLNLLGLAGKFTTMGAAGGVGVTCGFAAASIIQRLKRSELGRVPGTEAYKGVEGKILLPISAESRGMVRISVDGRLVDLRAKADEGVTLERGEKVLLIDYAENEAHVVSAKDLSETT